MRYERIANKIVIAQSRTAAVIRDIFLLIIIIGWPWVILGRLKHLQEAIAIVFDLRDELIDMPPESIFYIVSCLPLFLIPSLIKNFRVAIAGHKIIIDGTVKKIFRNDKELLHFSEIRNLDFRSMDDDTLRLDFILHNGKKVKLGKIGTSKNADTYKADIGDIVQFSEKTLDEIPREKGFGKAFTFAYYLFLTISILLLVGSVYAISSSILLTLVGTTTTGRVVDTEIETIERIKELRQRGHPKREVRTKSTVYISTIEYRDTRGTLHLFKTSAVDTGSNVPVVYLKFWPQFVRVKSFSGMWGAFVILLFFGLLTFYLAQFFNKKSHKKINEKKNALNDENSTQP